MSFAISICVGTHTNSNNSKFNLKKIVTQIHTLHKKNLSRKDICFSRCAKEIGFIPFIIRFINHSIRFEQILTLYISIYECLSSIIYMYAQTFITIPLKKNSFPVAAENEHKI